MKIASDPLDDLLRLQVMLLRRASATQQDLILEMAAAGFAPGRIADLLNIASNTVTGAISKSAKKASS
jgi:DNA-binding CsgD family transcriptional regulator